MLMRMGHMDLPLRGGYLDCLKYARVNVFGLSCTTLLLDVDICTVLSMLVRMGVN